ncbi:MAG: hypothetical protein KO206_03070 [Methanomicrobiaceae archaeon]|uniref:Uncharacterized protein n=1 Tax=hydrocarbon metagenome TaxID=938273 RepID=A0A0W8FJC1_9ZZZZ|nr:hypothetical protein [Methanomicrobiaceae archaeon]MDD5418635.1 hypothetical protein [Methanomicrobiaceae archaeon]
MSEKKEVTISITINLGNYENIRLEVEGKAENQQQAEGLISFLDEMLARLGRGDEATAERVDAYRRRVFGTGIEAAAGSIKEPAVTGEGAESAGGGKETADEPEPAKICAADIIQEAIPPAPHEREHEAAGERAARTEAAPPADAARAKTASHETPPETGFTCEICDAPVTKSQAKLSQLFMGKTLCKKCMERP